MATLMQELGIAPDIIDKCLAHAVNDKIRRIYFRAELRSLMKDAWQKWGDKLYGLLAQAHTELKQELLEEAKAEEAENTKKKAYTPRLRNARSGRGVAPPLLDVLAPFALKPHREQHAHG
jgi:hypothetical protein